MVFVDEEVASSMDVAGTDIVDTLGIQAAGAGAGRDDTFDVVVAEYNASYFEEEGRDLEMGKKLVLAVGRLISIFHFQP